MTYGRCLPESVGRGVQSHEVLGGEEDDAGGVKAEQLNVKAVAAPQRPSRRRVPAAARHRLNEHNKTALLLVPSYHIMF